VLLVIAVGWFLLVSPQRSTASKLSGEISDAQNKLTLDLAQERTLRREQHSRAAQLAALTKALPAQVQMPGILRQLSGTAAQAGVRVDTITPGTTAGGLGYNTVPLAVTVEGHYFGIMNFVHLLRTRAQFVGSKLDASGRFYAVQQMQFGGGAGANGTSSGVLQVTMTINAYTSVPSTPATATPTSSTPTASSLSGGTSSATATAP
jgi:hypothetical protein